MEATTTDDQTITDDAVQDAGNVLGEGETAAAEPAKPRGSTGPTDYVVLRSEPMAEGDPIPADVKGVALFPCGAVSAHSPEQARRAAFEHDVAESEVEKRGGAYYLVVPARSYGDGAKRYRYKPREDDELVAE